MPVVECWKYWGDFRRGLEMTKLLHQQEDHLSVIFLGYQRLFPQYCMSGN